MVLNIIGPKWNFEGRIFNVDCTYIYYKIKCVLDYNSKILKLSLLTL